MRGVKIVGHSVLLAVVILSFMAGSSMAQGGPSCTITGDAGGCAPQQICGPEGNFSYYWARPFGGIEFTRCISAIEEGGAYILWVTDLATGLQGEPCFFKFHPVCEPPPPPCVVPGTINSNFNGTAIVGVSSGPAFIWFNSNLSAKGMTSGTSIFLTDSKVFINGVGHDVPDAKITFAPVACATTTFDTGTGTWVTTVPLAGSDEIFLSGLAFPVDNLPGGAKVTWQGNFSTDQAGACLSWKWGAAAYKSFTTLSTTPLVIDYNAAQIKPAHQLACGINNGDHAGTPQNAAIRSTVTGGARGGGGSNFTGSWSGTGSLCPSCPSASGLGLESYASTNSDTRITTVDEPSLAAPIPNPAAHSSTFSFALPRAAEVSLVVYDVAGRQVGQLAQGTQSAGVHTLSWDLRTSDGNPVSRGIYFVRLKVEGRVLSRSLVVTNN